jgi:heat shock protein HslJ
MRALRLPLLVLATVLVAACGATTTGGTPAASAQAPTPGPTSDPASPGSSGAASPDPSAMAPIADPTVLVGRTFVSTDSTGHDLVPGSQVRLAFQDGGQLGVSAGCNSMGGPYAITDSTLDITGPMMQTEMACDAPLMDQDTWIAGFLDGAVMTFNGTTLLLVNDGVTLTLVDEEVASPDLPIEGTTWVVEGLVQNQAVSSVPAGLTSTLVFADGKVSYAGCNRGSGEATIGEGAITFGPMATTRMACPEPAMNLESFVLGVLTGEVRATVDADTLHLLGAGGGLDLRAQK